VKVIRFRVHLNLFAVDLCKYSGIDQTYEGSRCGKTKFTARSERNWSTFDNYCFFAQSRPNIFL